METNAIRASLYMWTTLTCFWICKFCYRIKNYIYHRTRSNTMPYTVLDYFALTNASCSLISHYFQNNIYVPHNGPNLPLADIYHFVGTAWHCNSNFTYHWSFTNPLFLWREREKEIIKFLKNICYNFNEELSQIMKINSDKQHFLVFTIYFCKNKEYF